MIDLQRTLVALAIRAGVHATGQSLRRLSVMTSALLRRPATIATQMTGLRDTARLHSQETGSWVDAGTLMREGGPFDACDLRCWIAIASRAGVPFVPAMEILSLTQSEMGELSGVVKMPDNAVTRGNSARAGVLDDYKEVLGEIGEALGGGERVTDTEGLIERLYAAMDGVPEGWMVRNARAGSIELKTLAGAGAIGDVAPEVRFGSDLEVGPGWVRTGNRRRVHVSDSRTVQAVAQGPNGPTAFLARPWVRAARYVVGDDPHRHGTQFAGKGVWPAEWRAFIEDGVVVGVSWYYGWCGSITAQNARMSLEVRRRAQMMADAASALRAWPRYMDVEFARSSGRLDGAFGRETVSCTLDFIETSEDGPVFLEGGPANTPFGGGHPCAFAGNGGPPRFGNKTVTRGVAFDMMEGVLLGDPSTWQENDPHLHILDWEAVAALAA